MEAARDVFTRMGFDGARTSEIAKLAGVPQGLLYHHFDSKAGLFRAALEEALEPFAEQSVHFLSGDPKTNGWREFLASGIREYFEFLKHNHQVPRLVGWWRIRSRHEEPLPMSLGVNVRAKGAARIKQGQEDGSVREDLDPMTVIDLAVSLCMMWHQSWEVFAHMEGIDPGDKEQVEALHERRLHHITEVLLDGVLKTKK